MIKTFRIEAEVGIDENDFGKVIASAREQWASCGGATEFTEDGAGRKLTAEDGISSIEAAVMELFLTTPDIPFATYQSSVTESDKPRSSDNGGIGDSPAVEEDAEEMPYDEELDDFDQAVWLCRWPNGDSAVAFAGSKREAMSALDQFGSADPSLMKNAGKLLPRYRSYRFRRTANA